MADPTGPSTGTSRTTPRRGWWGRLTRRLWGERRGAAAVEFALIAAPFMFLLGAIFELAILFLATQILDSATAEAARLIRTGQAQQLKYTSDLFKAEVCNRLYALFDCNNVYVESKVYSNFATIGDLTSMTSYVDSSGNFDPTKVTKYEPGSGSQIVVVRTFYAYPVVFKNLLWDETSAPGGKILMTGVAVFRNEPFPW